MVSETPNFVYGTLLKLIAIKVNSSTDDLGRKLNFSRLVNIFHVKTYEGGY